MTEIKKIAVIGSGVMGAAIAAQIANSGTQVLLYDIVPDGADNRTSIATDAIAKLLKTDPAPLAHKRNAQLITPCNLEDDLEQLGDVDWVIEVIIERLDIKQNLYKKLEKYTNKNAVISSNTSTLPLQNLVDNMGDEFKNRFMITHFFNPPRYMQLLELVAGNVAADKVAAIRDFCDIKLGKNVVECKDTAGFIANRIGIFWIAAAMKHAFEMGISIEDADGVMGRPMGIPKTGVFGLMDLIGIDLLPLIAQSFSQTLDKNDEFFKFYEEHDLLSKMIADGYTGRKGKGGFYRLNTDDGKRVKESINLTDGSYSISAKSKLESVKVGAKNLHKLIEHDDIGGRFAWAVLRDVLLYTASLIPEISDDIKAVDDAMRTGYNWKFGPFELLDKLGAKYFVDKVTAEGLEVPEILKIAAEKSFYIEDDEAKSYITLGGEYQKIPFNPDSHMLADIKRGKQPITKNSAASLWDLGDGIACLEFHTKMNSLDPDSMTMITKSIKIVEKDYKGMVIANDATNFCAGANIGLALFAANLGAFKMLKEFIKQGQDTYMGLKYAPFPVVAAPSGLALGGGCEILLHADAVQAHIETYTGLVEVGVGLIPGWGGCKELIYRNLAARAKSDCVAAKFGNWFSFLSPIKTLNTMPALEPAFRNISTANVAKSAEQARDMLILNDKSRITMNRQRLLPDAKALCLELAQDYTAPISHPIHLPGKTARVAFDMAIKSFVKSGKATAHDEVVSTAVGYVLSGGKTDITQEITEQKLLDLEREQFDNLLRNPDTLARIEHMLETGKPLRN